MKTQTQQATTKQKQDKNPLKLQIYLLGGQMSTIKMSILDFSYVYPFHIYLIDFVTTMSFLSIYIYMFLGTPFYF